MATKKRSTSKKAKRKKVKFRKVALKITSGQKKKIDRFCTYHRTTMNRFVKKAIREYIEVHGGDIPGDEPVIKNQLKLFDPDEFTTGRQMDIFDVVDQVEGS